VSSEDRSGELLASKYRLVSLLGSGAMGHVYRATNELIGRPVALKLLRKEHAKNAEIVDRFVREARAANLVRHPNVVNILDMGREEDGTPFIVQQLLEGEDLAAYVTRVGGRISREEVVELLCPVIDAVAEAHACSVVHRDIKPANVFLAMESGRRVPMLLDFGISKIRHPQGGVRETEVGMLMGTPAYMPPELIQGAKIADARSDVWAIGVMLFELLAGRLPFEGDDAVGLFVTVATTDAPRLIDVEPHVPPDLSKIVERCLRRAPADRYPSAAELARDLRLVILGCDIEVTGRFSLPPSLLEKGAVVAIPKPAGLPEAPELDLPPPKPKAAPATAPAPSLSPVRPPAPAPAPAPAPPVSRPRPPASASMFQDAPHASLPPRGRDLQHGGGASALAGVPLPAVVAGVAVVVLGLLTAIARSTFGWEAAVALHLPPGLQAPVQWLLAVGCGVAGAALGRRGLEHARGDRLGGLVGSSLNGLGAGVAFFVAIELARAAM
jgi:serine/threonine protein kinase